MTSPFESSVRDSLQRLAEAPPARSLVDRALSDARRIRRRRRTLAALAAIAIVGGGTATPFVLTARGGNAPVGTTPTTATARPTTECRTATHEPSPFAGAIPDTWPSFIGIVMAHLPPRDDYYVSSGYGLCEDMGASAGRVVMSIGEQGEHGQFVVELITDFQKLIQGPNVITPSAFNISAYFTCPGLQAEHVEVYFCEEATETQPLAFAGRDHRGDMWVFAYYPDRRYIVLENNDTILDLPTMRAIVTDPELAALLQR